MHFQLYVLQQVIIFLSTTINNRLHNKIKKINNKLNTILLNLLSRDQNDEQWMHK